MKRIWYGIAWVLLPCIAAQQEQLQLSPTEVEAMMAPLAAIFKQLPPLDTVRPLLSIDAVPYVSAEMYFEYFFAQHAKEWMAPVTAPSGLVDIGLDVAALFCINEAFVILEHAGGDIVRAKEYSADVRQQVVGTFIQESITRTKQHVEDNILIQEQVDAWVRQLGGIPEGIDVKQVYTNQSGVAIPLFMMDSMCQKDLLERVNQFMNKYKDRAEVNDEVITMLAKMLTSFMEVMEKEKAAPNGAKV